MKRLRLLFIACLVALSLLSTNAFAQKHRKPKAKKKACATSLASCPDDGCGGTFDHELNRAKNQATEPSDSDVVDMTLSQIKHISQPPSWTANKPRDTLKGAKKEGQAVRGMAFLWVAKPEHGEPG